jgi:hypothetical protein
MSPIACIFFQVSHNFMKHCSCSVFLSLIFSFLLSFRSFFPFLFFVGARVVFTIFFPHQAIFIPPPELNSHIFEVLFFPIRSPTDRYCRRFFSSLNTLGVWYVPCLYYVRLSKEASSELGALSLSSISNCSITIKISHLNSVVDPDPYVFGPPGSGSVNQRHGSRSGSFYRQAKIVRKTLIPTVL